MEDQKHFTIRELRKILFEIDNQDQIIRFGNLDFLLKEIN